MRRVLGLLLLAVAGCSVPSPKPPPAWAVDFLPGPGPYKFDCNAPGGQYSLRNIQVPTGPFRVTGLIQFSMERYDLGWAPVGRVNVEDSAGISARPGLEILVRAANPTVFRIAFGRLRRETLLGTMPVTKLPIPFSLRMDDSGMLSGTLGRASAPALPQVAGVKRLTLFCSTGHVIFSEVTVTPSP
jgi:hypothetical protein